MDGRWGVVMAGGLVAVAAALGAISVGGDDSPPAAAQAPSVPVVARTVTVNGHGVATAKPDTASVSLGISVTAASAHEALEESSRKAQALLGTLRDVGIADDDIVTTNVSLWPQHGNNSRIQGYQASNDVRVTIRDLDNAGRVIDAAATAVGDAARVNGIAFTIDDTSDAIAAARADAIRDAALRAGQYAAAVNMGVGVVVQISDQQVTNPWPVMYGAQAAALDERASVPLQPGTQDLTVDVTVVYELTT